MWDTHKSQTWKIYCFVFVTLPKQVKSLRCPAATQRRKVNPLSLPLLHSFTEGCWPSRVPFVFMRQWRLLGRSRFTRITQWPSESDSFCHSFLIQLTCSHLLVAGVSFLSSFGRYMLHWFMRCQCSVVVLVAALFIICLAGYFVSLYYFGHICGSFCTCSACLIMTTEFHYPFEIRIVINLIDIYYIHIHIHTYSLLISILHVLPKMLHAFIY